MTEGGGRRTQTRLEPAGAAGPGGAGGAGQIGAGEAKKKYWGVQT